MGKAAERYPLKQEDELNWDKKFYLFLLNSRNNIKPLTEKLKNYVVLHI
jgi:hypothetical protein